MVEPGVLIPVQKGLLRANHIGINTHFTDEKTEA